MPPPPSSPQQARINLGDLKSQIAKRLGPDRARLYFSFLNRLLSQKLSKSEFHKLCISTLGHENIPLHNQLIRSILRNAYQAKVPPLLVVDKSGSKSIVGKKSLQGDDGFNPSPAQVQLPPVWSNGDILPPSPRRCRTGIRDRRIKDRPSPLGPNGRTEGIAHHQSLVSPDEGVVRENGDLSLCDLKRPVQHQHGGLAEQPAKRSRKVEKSSFVDVGDVDSEDAEQRCDVELARGPLRAPLGIPFCPPSVGGARRPLPLVTSSAIGDFSSSCDSGELCHTEDLRKKMENIAEAQGLGGVAMDCANLLNNGLDAYLKRLIRSCVDLVGSRLGQGSIKQQPVSKQQVHGKPINGVWVGNHTHVQSGGPHLDSVHEQRNSFPISLQDFTVAMEMNPQQLGEDWPLLLEKICIRSFEE